MSLRHSPGDNMIPHFVTFTLEVIVKSNAESRKERMLNIFRYAGSGTMNNNEYQLLNICNSNFPTVF